MERHTLIERLLEHEGRVSVVELASRFDVTPETIRRDLDALEGAGKLRRVHGGAVFMSEGSVIEPTLGERAERGSAAKLAIARAAREELGGSFRGSIYFDAGTTTAAVAAEISSVRSADTDGIGAVTHAMTPAAALAGAPGVDLTLIGGRVRGTTAAAVGADTVHAISRLRPDVAYLGANGISASFGLSTPDTEEAAVKRAVIAAARRVIAVIDASKHGSELLVQFAELNQIDTLITDIRPPRALDEALSEAGTRVVLA